MSLFQDSTSSCPFHPAFLSHPVSVAPSAEGLQSLGAGEHHLVNHPRPVIFFLDVLFTLVHFCEFLALIFLSLWFLETYPDYLPDPGFCLLSILPILLCPWSVAVVLGNCSSQRNEAK